MTRSVLLAALVCAMALPSRGAPTAATRDLHLNNGDQELPAASGPPPGWAMWGDQRFKDPRNYTRDTAKPHGGSACLRIHHPAGTAGYLVTNPAHALRPKPQRRYTVSFWARADRPGAASFGFTAYSSIAPFVDAPPRGTYPIQVGPDWRRYSFTLREGRDFFADQCRYLLLTFHAARDDAEERTLFVDDVLATEAPWRDPHPLLNLNTISHDPLRHRLSPGPALDFTADARRRERRAVRMVGGVSFHRLVGFTGQPYDREGRYTLDPRLEQAIREMRLPMTRLYGVGDEPFGVEGALDRVAELCRRVGLAQETVVLELEPQSADRALPPETWARAARYSRSRGYRFRYWEVGNETYSSLWHQGGAFPTPESYVAHLRAVSRALRRAQPGAQVGVSVYAESLPWGNQVLREAAGSYDFVVPHYYSGASVHRESFEDLVLTANYRILDQALRVGALIRAYNPHRSVYQLDTEWGMISGGPEGQAADYVPRNANVIGLVHRAVRLIYYAREGMLRGASAWQMLSNLNGPGFGILSQQAPDQRFLLYWLSYYFNRHVGEWVVPISGTAPYQAAVNQRAGGLPTAAPGPLTPVLATRSADGRDLYLVAANGSWERAVSLRAQLRGFQAGRARTLVLSQPSMDSSPLLAKTEDAVRPLAVRLSGGVLTAMLPAHSVVFVTLESSSGTTRGGSRRVR